MIVKTNLSQLNLIAIYLFILTGIFSFHSCSVIEKSSIHGFESGFYQFHPQDEKAKDVYLNITEETIDIYPKAEEIRSEEALINIPLVPSDSLYALPIRFSKKSLDIDITSILFKCRPGVDGLPLQMTADFNAGIYAGWRHDNYHITGEKSPLGKYRYGVVNRGYDFGVFAGPGTTLIGPFTTHDSIASEYNGMIIQFGVAGFIESNAASFGLAVGYDYLLSPDRDIWIYNNKPWFGFIIGIALN